MSFCQLGLSDVRWRLLASFFVGEVSRHSKYCEGTHCFLQAKLRQRLLNVVHRLNRDAEKLRAIRDGMQGDVRLRA